MRPRSSASGPTDRRDSRDLRLWVDEIAHAGDGWVPSRFEWAFGPKSGGALAEGRDPDSRLDPALSIRFLLHGAITGSGSRSLLAGTYVDAVTAALRRQLPRHRSQTGKFRGKERMVIGGGRTLERRCAAALETATGCPVVQGRLYYATTDGGFRDVTIK